MPLDPHELVRQIEAVVPKLKGNFRDQKNNVGDALTLYKSAVAKEWRNLVKAEQAREVMGYPIGDLHQSNDIEAANEVYTVIATDGSTIPPDRHNGTALYHVINTGRVMLRYGQNSDAQLDSRTIFFADDLTEEEVESSKPLIIDLERDLYELKEGLELAREHQSNLVLMDGPLTMWNSRTLTDKKSKELRDGYYNLLNVFREERIPIVGYISNTHSQSVTNSLRLILRERPQATLFEDETFSKPAARPKSRSKSRVGGLNGVQDADLFRHLLKPGHYSEIFKTAFSEPKELAEHIEEVCFVYWRAENEIVRLEFPEWLIDQLPQAMSLVKDQYQRGQGYPVALMEAHESAVLRNADRELLRILLEERGLLQAESEKGRSKRLRNI